MTTTSVPTTTAPSIAAPETDLTTPPAPRRRPRRLVTALALAALAGGGATVWVTAAGGGDAAPVEIVQDGRSGGPDVYEHGRPAPEGATTDGQQFGSADAAERQTAPEQPLPSGTDPRVFP